MATAQSGQNPGYAHSPQRQSPARKNSGRGSNAEPTSPSNQTPSEIFGASTALSSTGLGGSSGYHAGSDVTEHGDQTYQGTTGQTVDHSQTTLSGSAGASVPTGGNSVTYTDPFGIQGGVNRDITAQGAVDGSNDWTQFSAKYDHGPTLPGLEGNRPTSTGVGQGRIRGAGKGL